MVLATNGGKKKNKFTEQTTMVVLRFLLRSHSMRVRVDLFEPVTYVPLLCVGPPLPE